jgi:hypothetical protein
MSSLGERAGEPGRQAARCGSHEFVQQNKLACESLSLASGILSALVGAVFTRIWRAMSDTDEAPEPTALDRNAREVLVAGAL